MGDELGLKGRDNGEETNKQGPEEKACGQGLKGAACGQGCDRQGPMGKG